MAACQLYVHAEGVPGAPHQRAPLRARREGGAQPLGTPRARGAAAVRLRQLPLELQLRRLVGVRVTIRARVRVGVRFRVRVRVTLLLRRLQLRARRLQLCGALLLLAAQRDEGAPLRRW